MKIKALIMFIAAAIGGATAYGLSGNESTTTEVNTLVTAQAKQLSNQNITPVSSNEEQAPTTIEAISRSVNTSKIQDEANDIELGYQQMPLEKLMVMNWEEVELVDLQANVLAYLQDENLPRETRIKTVFTHMERFLANGDLAKANYLVDMMAHLKPIEVSQQAMDLYATNDSVESQQILLKLLTNAAEYINLEGISDQEREASGEQSYAIQTFIRDELANASNPALATDLFNSYTSLASGDELEQAFNEHYKMGSLSPVNKESVVNAGLALSLESSETQNRVFPATLDMMKEQPVQRSMDKLTVMFDSVPADTFTTESKQQIKAFIADRKPALSQNEVDANTVIDHANWHSLNGKLETNDDNDLIAYKVQQIYSASSTLEAASIIALANSDVIKAVKLANDYPQLITQFEGKLSNEQLSPVEEQLYQTALLELSKV